MYTMKTSILLLALILINTSALISESLASLVSQIDTWLLVCIEIGLLVTFFIHKTLKELKEGYTINLSNLKWSVFKDSHKS